jgi:hypothetical protein
MAMETGTIIGVVSLVAVFVVPLIWRSLSKDSRIDSTLEAKFAACSRRHETIVEQFIKPCMGKALTFPKNTVELGSVVLAPREQILSVSPVVVNRTVKLGSQWRSGSRGARIRIAKGLSFYTGGSRGQMVPILEGQVAEGILVLTTQRVVFNGDDFSFAEPVKKVKNISVDGNTVHFDFSSRDTPNCKAHFTNSMFVKIFTTRYSDPDEELLLPSVAVE